MLRNADLFAHVLGGFLKHRPLSLRSRCSERFAGSERPVQCCADTAAVVMLHEKLPEDILWVAKNGSRSGESR